MLDPSKLTKKMLSDLLSYWDERRRAKIPILKFVAAPSQDRRRPRALRLDPDLETSPAVRKRKAVAFVGLSSDDEAGDGDDDELEDGHTGKGKDRADKDKRNHGSSVRQPLSKRHRLFKRPASPEEKSPEEQSEQSPEEQSPRELSIAEQSPASNSRDMTKYLYSLSSESCYKTLLDTVLALPLLVSPLFSSSI